MSTNCRKFQQLLRELFQFDCADLDFGIYRIMNYKRDVIEKFISTDLPKAIADELDRGALGAQSQAAAQLVETAQQIAQTLGKDALDADGNLAEAYHGTPVGKKYLDLRDKAAGGRGREALEATIFNHLYAFFSRYYQDGDFISKRRYSKRQKYAIPYNGEEVYLHWANHDQYYVKTAEHFHDYTFTSRGVTVHFKLTAANVEQNNVKGDKRFFLPRVKEVEWNEKAGELVVPFEFRPLTDQEQAAYGTKSQQDKIIAEAVDAIPKRLKKADKPLVAITAERRKNSDGKSVTFLEHHLRQYTRKNTSDFFIHKDLKGFLSRELDFYLKNEVLNLDEMQAAGEDRAEGWFQVLRVIKAVGSRIIDFLDQIESFQKMLWEKRKFVTETQYCITVGAIDERFYPDIAACDAQWAEWKELFHIDEEQSDLFTNGKSKKGRRIEFLKAHPTLVLDTSHFSALFVDTLLTHFADIDGLSDGLLIHADNYQALQLLSERYRDSIKCVYIDPPYNTGTDGFNYKDSYQHSSWLSFLRDRIVASLILLDRAGVFLSSIDDIEVDRLRSLLDSFTNRDACLGTFVWKRRITSSLAQSWLSTDHEYVVAYAREPSLVQIRGTEKDTSKYNRDDGDGRKYASMPLTVGMNRYQRPNQWYALINPQTGTEYWPPDNRVWCYYPPTMEDKVRENRILWPEDYPESRMTTPRLKAYADESQRDHKPVSSWIAEINHTEDDDVTQLSCGRNEEGTRWLNNLFQIAETVYPKPVSLLRELITQFVFDDDTILDYFAGSGTTAHAAIDVNRDDGGRRRFILVETGDYFYTILLPRIKKLTFAPKWKGGKPHRLPTAEEADRSPRIIKYLRLEGYEDSLGNIGFDNESGQGALHFDDYLIQYMLKWETRKSETLLNVEQLAKPFSYKLTVAKGDETTDKVVDLPETFNYLLGLHVSTRKVYDDDGRRYLVYHGRIDHRRIAVIWRETEGWQKKDLERDKKFVAMQKLADGADEVFVNGDSFIPNAKALEPVFKARMFSGMMNGE